MAKRIMNERKQVMSEKKHHQDARRCTTSEAFKLVWSASKKHLGKFWLDSAGWSCRQRNLGWQNDC